MARPKLGDTETERMQLKITASEIEAIDDWRFQNRVPSRSEAVRRLCQIGIRVQKALPGIANDIAQVLDMIAEATEVPEYILAHTDEDANQPEVDKIIASKLYDAVNFAFNRQIDAQDNLFHLLVEIDPLVSNEEFSEAVRRANEEAKSDVLNESILKKIGASRSAQLKYWRKRREQILSSKESYSEWLNRKEVDE